MSKHVKCPNCGKQIIWNTQAKWRPFCSERCKLIDLGEWASESHRIPGETISEENLNELGNKQELN